MCARIVTLVMEPVFSLVRSLSAGKADLVLEVLALCHRPAGWKSNKPTPGLGALYRPPWSVLKERFPVRADGILVRIRAAAWTDVEASSAPHCSPPEVCPVC